LPAGESEVAVVNVAVRWPFETPITTIPRWIIDLIYREELAGVELIGTIGAATVFLAN